jgi:apoptosis-inducing factor 3
MPDTSTPSSKDGIALDDIPDGGMLRVTLGDEQLLLVRRGREVFAIGAQCSHYHGPLAEGLLVGNTLRCPLHHACFDIRSGEPLRAPALDPVSCWRVERRGDRVFIGGKLEAPARRLAIASRAPRSVVIVGGGAAGIGAAVALRREGYEGPLTMITADDAAPYDRPNLSKDFLAGTAPEEWMPLRSPEFYTDNGIELVLGARAASLDVRDRRVTLTSGRTFSYDALLLATGAEASRLGIPGATEGQICYLRTFADCRAIRAKIAAAARVAVVGASFIGLEVAASLRARGIEVHVIGREAVPMEHVLGTEVGRLLRAWHESHGVIFHLGGTIERLQGGRLTLTDQTRLDVDAVVAGVGVRPAVALAEAAGLALDRGVLVDEYLQTSAPGVFAAGDIARWPDRYSGERIRVEHWVVAERQGQTAARNMLGFAEPFQGVPFFWSQHYDLSINYLGHAERWDRVEIDGSLEAHHCAVSYRRGDRTLAIATIGRDRDSLQAEWTQESRT